MIPTQNDFYILEEMMKELRFLKNQYNSDNEEEINQLMNQIVYFSQQIDTKGVTKKYIGKQLTYTTLEFMFSDLKETFKKI